MYHTHPSSFAKIVSIISGMVPSAFANSNHITVQSNSCFYLRKPVLPSCPAATPMRLNQFFRYSLANHLPPPVVSNSSLIRESRYSLRMVRQLSAVESTTSLRDPSFVSTYSIGATVAERVRRTLPVGCFSSRYQCCASSSSQIILQTPPVCIIACGSCRGIP